MSSKDYKQTKRIEGTFLYGKRRKQRGKQRKYIKSVEALSLYLAMLKK